MRGKGGKGEGRCLAEGTRMRLRTGGRKEESSGPASNHSSFAVRCLIDDGRVCRRRDYKEYNGSKARICICRARCWRHGILGLVFNSLGSPGVGRWRFGADLAGRLTKQRGRIAERGKGGGLKRPRKGGCGIVCRERERADWDGGDITKDASPISEN